LGQLLDLHTSCASKRAIILFQEEDMDPWEDEIRTTTAMAMTETTLEKGEGCSSFRASAAREAVKVHTAGAAKPTHQQRQATNLNQT